MEKVADPAGGVVQPTPDSRPKCQCSCSTQQNTQAPAVPPAVADTSRHPVRYHRGRSYSRDRASQSSRSVSPIRPAFGRRRSPTRAHVQSRQLDEVFSYENLIPVHKSTSDVMSKDRFVRVVPFSRTVYLTTHAATPVDFRHWLPLLALAVPDQWFSYSTPSIGAGFEAVSPGLLASLLLTPFENPRPAGLSVPWITASVALRSQLDDDRDAEEPPLLLYRSVQQAVAGRPRNVDSYEMRHGLRDREAEGPATGTPLYRVVQSGSRDAAAARAFYDAGGNRWSTVFVCAFKDDEGIAGRALVPKPTSFERVDTLDELVEDVGTEGKTRVFY